jgi:hypothetical protein
MNKRQVDSLALGDKIVYVGRDNGCFVHGLSCEIFDGSGSVGWYRSVRCSRGDIHGIYELQWKDWEASKFKEAS